MNLKTLSLFSFSLVALYFTVANAATINIRNNCPFTVWAAAVPGGGMQLDSGGVWDITANPGTTGTRVWARTNCQFDGAGRGSCQTGDCGGLLECQAYTLAEYALNQFNNLDFFDISLVDGFNVPMDFSPTSGGCTRDYSKFFKDRCPDAYSYPKDDQTSTFTCPGGTNYRVVFCP
ncbi:hypothetical protein SCA6_005265 [Theobroma cacao]